MCTLIHHLWKLLLLYHRVIPRLAPLAPENSVLPPPVTWFMTSLSRYMMQESVHDVRLRVVVRIHNLHFVDLLNLLPPLLHQCWNRGSASLDHVRLSASVPSQPFDISLSSIGLDRNTLKLKSIDYEVKSYNTPQGLYLKGAA